MSDEIYPVSIEREGANSIRMTWSDGRVLTYSASVLRNACPCATCREKRNAAAEKPKASLSLPVLAANELQPLTITGMHPVGNYAYNIRFSDGHDSGIFSFSMLLSQ